MHSTQHLVLQMLRSQKKKYDEGEAKEGVGAGAALGYAKVNELSNEELLRQVELLIYML